MDVYTERTIELMKDKGFDRYLKLMTKDNMIPNSNLITLVYLKMKDFEKESNSQILAEAVKRREVLNG